MVDIIIPAYNCSKTLPRLLASIGAQTKPEKCIVTIVDDCSTEDLKPIIKDFKKHFNIKLQYIRLEENLKWPGLVRQAGLDRTNAPYVMFLDSDDFLDPCAVEHSLVEMRNTNADVLIGYFYGEDKNNQWRIFDETQVTWLHGNIYKRDFLVKNDIHFEPFYNEDGAFNTECYVLSENTCYLREPIYFWTYNKNSITKTDFFKTNNLPFYVQSLQITYEKLFQKTKKDFLYKNLGGHIYNFYEKLNELILRIDNGLADEKELYEKETLIPLIKEFSVFLLNQNFSEKEIKLIKERFLDDLTKEKHERRGVASSDFWQDYGFEKVFGGLWDR
jgi:glycosyltransferase involved in cell wall biosynthesis